MRKTVRTIDLFAGAGGLSCGFAAADRGFEPVLAVEVEAAAARTFKRNFPNTTVHDSSIESLQRASIESLDAQVVIGGPPCQGFSPLGRDRDADTRAQMNDLWMRYVDIVKWAQPMVFLIENVPEFLRSSQYAAFRRHCARSPYLRHYEIDHRVLNAVDFGVPQRRRRGFIIGSAVGNPTDWWPEPTHGDAPGVTAPHRTVRDAIGDLPFRPADPDSWYELDEIARLHIGRRPTPKSLARYRVVPEGGNRFDLARNRPDLLPACWANKPSGTTDVFGRLWWDRPSFTIRTEFFKPEKGRYLHPEADRPITHREAARLQTFPDDFVFEGNKLEVARQIGNAVPPTIARRLAELIADHLPG